MYGKRGVRVRDSHRNAALFRRRHERRALDHFVRVNRDIRSVFLYYFYRFKPAVRSIRGCAYAM